MRQLDSEAKKTSANILKSLYESAASVKKQINTDKPNEAPKEEKEALVKKVQKPEVPHKEHIIEGADNNLATFRVYGTIGADATYPNEKTLEDLIKDCIDAAKTRYNVDVTIKDSGKESFRDEYELLVTGPKEATAEYVWDYFDGKNADSIEEIYDEYLVECDNTNLTEAEDPFKDEKIRQLQDKVAELQAYLDDTPEVPEDEKTSIQNQIDEMLDEINYLENGLEESSLIEARNPENDEANELIRTALNDPEYAKNHVTELRKHGIKYLKPEKGYDNGALEGKQGRRLNINKSDWRKNDVRDATDYSDGYYGNDAYSKGYKSDDAHADEIDLHQKNYKNSKSDYALAKNNIKRQRTKVANMKKKDAGKWNGKTFDAEQKLKGYENTLKRGITAGFAPSDSIHPDTDLKGFLNAKKHSDRPLAREKDSKYRRDRGVIVDPANKDVEDYKWAKSERRYLDRERERINQSNQEDRDRIEEMKKRAAEEKARREKGYKAQEKDWKNVDTRLNKKLDKYRQRMSK